MIRYILGSFRVGILGPSISVHHIWALWAQGGNPKPQTLNLCRVLAQQVSELTEGAPGTEGSLLAIVSRRCLVLGGKSAKILSCSLGPRV